jgi:glycosyltransferase involved in cell wall biosynthesis
MSKKLSIAIPNYNRLEKLKRLVDEVIRQIQIGKLEEDVQICISDDFSLEDPSEIMNEFIEKFPLIDIKYTRKNSNQGMDCNFLDSVLLSDAEFCWIIGNDDVPTEDALEKLIEYINLNDFDFLVTPFDVFSEVGEYRTTIEPLEFREKISFNTFKKLDRDKLVLGIRHNSGLFGFLSNVIFRRSIWEKNKNKFNDKMNTLFIQMYMNIEQLLEGAIYRYDSFKIIKNYADDDTNMSIDRICKILIGLDGVVEHFFTGAYKEHFKQILTDAYINGMVWSLEDDNKYKKALVKIESPKNTCYKKYYLDQTTCENVLKDKKVVIFGAGDYGKRTYNVLMAKNIEVDAVVDSDSNKIGKEFADLTIISYENMLQSFDKEKLFVIVANHFNLVNMIEKLNKSEVNNIGIIS